MPDIPDSPQAYLELLIATSASGAFPSKSDNPEDTESLTCRYRSTSGRRCAYGVLIPDSEYKPEMEGNSCYGLWQKNLFAIPSWGRCDQRMNEARFFDEVQSAHDDAAKQEEWDHEKFVERLLRCELFKGLVPVSETPCEARA